MSLFGARVLCSVAPEEFADRCRDRERVWSDLDDVDEVLDADEILGVACVEPGAVSVCCGGDEEIHHPRAWLSPSLGNGCGELAVAHRHVVVDRERVEGALELGEPAEPLRAHRRVSGDEYTEVKFRE